MTLWVGSTTLDHRSPIPSAIDAGTYSLLLGSKTLHASGNDRPGAAWTSR